MRIELRDSDRRWLGPIEVDPSQRPTRVTIGGQDHFLDWDIAIDDGGHLRRCVACECQDLYRVKAFPQITALVVMLAFTGVVISALNLTTPPMIIAMCIVLIVDIGIFLFAQQRLVCHRCRTSYHNLAIARYHRPWDRAVAERHAPPARSPARRTRRPLHRRLWPWRSTTPVASGTEPGAT